MQRKLVFGVGINDLPKVNFNDQCYTAWHSMIRRSYSEYFQRRNSSYIGCSVSIDWLRLSSFKEWMYSQDFKGNHLDKDIIKPGNKVYCPESCAFVSPETNSFVRDGGKNKGTYMLGVYLDTETGKYKAQCRNPFTRKKENLGRYDLEIDAHLAWKQRKHYLSCKLAELQTDARVYSALMVRYL